MWDYVPHSLLMEILCRLPIDSLVRFMCVSKEWCCLISSQEFISTHLSHSFRESLLVLLRHQLPYREENYSICQKLDHENQHLTFVKKLNIPFKMSMNGNRFKVVGFCNGLFCLSNDLSGYTNTIIVWNPAIRKSIFLHKPRPFSPLKVQPLYNCYHGFGFDQKTRDFKVVRIVYPRDYSCRVSEVEVYSLSKGLWKRLNLKNNIPGEIYQDNYCRSVYLNGNIHWITCNLDEGENDYTNSLLLFDLSNDTFSISMGLPQGLLHVTPDDLLLTLYGERICVVCHDFGDRFVNRCVVWVMNQYGEPESWTEKFVVVLEHSDIALGFRGTREFLFKRNGGVVSYDLESKEFKDVDIHGEIFSNKYVESLVLLDGSSGATADPSNDDDASHFAEPT